MSTPRQDDEAVEIPGEIVAILAELRGCVQGARLFTAPGTLVYRRDHKKAADVNRCLARLDTVLDALLAEISQPPAPRSTTNRNGCYRRTG